MKGSPSSIRSQSTLLSSYVSVSKSVSSTTPQASSASAAGSSLVSASTSVVSSSQSVIPPPPSGGSTGWLIARNPNVDRTNSDRFVPANVLAMYYVEQAPGTRSKIDTITLKSGAKGVLLEDISSIDTVTCSGSTISIGFTDSASAAIAKTWPAGTLIFTSAEGCNTANERGVYSVNEQGAGKTLNRRLTVAELLQLVVTREDLQTLIAALAEVIQQMAATSTTASLVSSSAASPDSSSSTPSPVASTLAPTSTQSTPPFMPQRLCGGYTTGHVISSAGDPWDVYCGYKGTAPLKQYNPYNPQLASMEDCFAHCKKTTNCMAVQWNQNNKGGECIPFTMLGLPNLSLRPANGLYDVAYLISEQPSSTQTSMPATLTSGDASSSSTIPYPRYPRVSTIDQNPPPTSQDFSTISSSLDSTAMTSSTGSSPTATWSPAS